MKLIEKVCLDNVTRIIYFCKIPCKYVKSFDEKNSRTIYDISFLGLKFRLYKKHTAQKNVLNQKPKIDKNVKLDALKSAKCINNLFNKIKTVNTMVLGTSEARAGFIEDETTINLGIDAQDLYYSYQLFEKYKDTIPNLKNLVIYYSPYSGGNDLDLSPHRLRQAFYKVYYDIPYKNKITAIKNKILDFEHELLKLNKYVIKNLHKMPTDIFAETSSGFMTMPELEKWAMSELKLKEKGGMLHWFDALIKSANEKAIRTYIVLMPRNPKVKHIYPTSDILYKEIFERNKNNNFKIINAFDYSFTEDDFVDLLHVTKKGAEKLTNIIRTKRWRHYLMAKTAIITLSYNHLEEATRLFFESLYKYTDVGKFDLIWIDNNSTDGTVEFLKEMEKIYSNLHVIYNSENIGYSKGNNCGLNYIKDKDYSFVGLLNNDILFTPNWLEDLIKGFEQDETLGMMSPRQNKKGQYTAENYLNKYQKFLKKLKYPIKYTITPFFSCVLIKKEVFDRIGFMDENFTPAYWEDNDYCFRAMYAGYSLAYNNRVFILHNHSTTSKPCQVNEIYGRNEKYFFKKHPIAKYIWAHKRSSVIKDIIKYIDKEGIY